jgi:alkylresorcinol/alkylpyrone synthase
MLPVARLFSLATSVPPYPLDQELVTERVKTLFADAPELPRVLPVFATSGIRRRYSCVPIDWYDWPHGWPERSRVYRRAALDLLEQTTVALLDRAGLDRSAIDAIVTVSTTGIVTPSLDALLIERMRLRRDIKRLPIFGLGCAGGVIGLARAASQAIAAPGETVLFLIVELCTLAFRRGDPSKSNIVATALFGDGAAGALLSTEAAGPAIVASAEHTWPGTLDIMGWDIAEDGFSAVFSRDIPHLVATEFRAAATDFLARNDLILDDIDRFVCHPGGVKVIEALETALSLRRGALAGARRVLRDHGNMSAATVMFVLEAMFAARLPWNLALMTALGPGFTAGFLLLDNR